MSPRAPRTPARFSAAVYSFRRLGASRVHVHDEIAVDASQADPDGALRRQGPSQEIQKSVEVGVRRGQLVDPGRLQEEHLDGRVLRTGPDVRDRHLPGDSGRIL
jgi:hypothetical protein